jgi:hypothetical protein
MNNNEHIQQITQKRWWEIQQQDTYSIQIKAWDAIFSILYEGKTDATQKAVWLSQIRNPDMKKLLSCTKDLIAVIWIDACDLSWRSSGENKGNRGIAWYMRINIDAKNKQSTGVKYNRDRAMVGAYDYDDAETYTIKVVET